MHKISPSKRGKWHFRDSTFQNFAGGAYPRTPLVVLARSALVGRTDVRPPKICNPVRLCVGIAMAAQKRLNNHQSCIHYRL